VPAAGSMPVTSAPIKKATLRVTFCIGGGGGGNLPGFRLQAKTAQTAASMLAETLSSPRVRAGRGLDACHISTNKKGHPSGDLLYWWWRRRESNPRHISLQSLYLGEFQLLNDGRGRNLGEKRLQLPACLLVVPLFDPAAICPGNHFRITMPHLFGNIQRVRAG